MFPLFTLIRILGIVIVIGAVLFGVTNFSSPIREKSAGVLGIQTMSPDSKEFPQQLQQDVSDSIEEAKKQGMQLRVEDVMSFVSQAQKILTDYQHAQKELEKQVNTFIKERAEKKEDEK